MANDISLSIGTNNIKNGSLVYGCSRTGIFQTKDTNVSNLPTITDIQSKYDNRFDDPSYYYAGGSGGTDGGDVGDVLGV